MPPPNPPKAQPDEELEEADGPLGPPEEEFWEKYNRRLEFPLSTVAAVLFHVLVLVCLYFLWDAMSRGTDRSQVPVKLINVEGGTDDVGEGSAGSGGQADPLAEGNPDKLKAAQDQLPTPDQLPEVMQDIRKIAIDDANGNLPISPSNAGAYKMLDENLRKKMLGSQKGAGPGSGKGFDGTPGSGPGGTGADSSRARSLRWVLRFRTSTGDDYVTQLAAMGAVLLIPLPPDNKDCLYVGDLKNPRVHRPATDDDLKRMANQIKFSDTRPDSVRGVCETIGAPSGVKSFWAFFPKGFEDDLSRKETGYRNRRSEDIDETVFRVVTRGGSYDIVVDDQTVKR